MHGSALLAAAAGVSPLASYLKRKLQRRPAEKEDALMKGYKPYLWWLTVPAAAWTVLLLADAPRHDPTVVTRATPSGTADTSRRSIAPGPAQSQNGSTPTSTCSGIS